MFMAADNLFRGAVISALDKKYVDNYIICTTAKKLWDALEPSSGFLMLVASCTSWSNCLITKWWITVL